MIDYALIKDQHSIQIAKYYMPTSQSLGITLQTGKSAKVILTLRVASNGNTNMHQHMMQYMLQLKIVINI